jgi:MoxR-like ATPase
MAEPDDRLTMEDISYGASPPGPISVVAAARGLAVLRDYVAPGDIEAALRDALRHRLVLAYSALAEEVTADIVLDEVLEAVAPPQIDPGRQHAVAVA